MIDISSTNTLSYLKILSPHRKILWQGLVGQTAVFFIEQPTEVIFCLDNVEILKFSEVFPDKKYSLELSYDIAHKSQPSINFTEIF